LKAHPGSEAGDPGGRGHTTRVVLESDRIFRDSAWADRGGGTKASGGGEGAPRDVEGDFFSAGGGGGGGGAGPTGCFAEGATERGPTVLRARELGRPAGWGARAQAGPSGGDGEKAGAHSGVLPLGPAEGGPGEFSGDLAGGRGGAARCM